MPQPSPSFAGPYFHHNPPLHSSVIMHHHQSHSNPYPVVPPPQMHKVWLLDCKSCGTFITNRGMKAVLLLRPNVPLYSSDALPVNCSAYTYNAHALVAPSCRPSSSSTVQRTCECLTQTLCCHGCGATVGYMIVIPCARCTSSVSSSNRATNGHRFVFHSSEVVGTERHYVVDEPGVIPYAESSPSAVYPSTQRADPTFASHYEFSLATRPAATYLPTPPLETGYVSPASSASTSPVTDSFLFSEYSRGHGSPFPYAPHPISHASRSLSHSFTRPSSPGSDDSDDSMPPPLESPPYPYGLPADQTVTPPPILKPGDILYWHHLTRHGEIPGVQEDARARQSTNPAAQKFVYNR